MMIGDPFRSPGTYDDLPEISRARGYRLYSREGGRYLDMYLDGGGAILGHRPEGLNRIFKSASSRGLWAPLPSASRGRLEKAVLRLVPIPFQGKVRLFPSLPAALSLISTHLPKSVLVDPLFPDALSTLTDKSLPLLLWRPFTEALFESVLGDLLGPSPERPLLILPMIPVPGWLSPQPLIVPSSMEAMLPPFSEAVSPALAEIGAEGLRMLAARLREEYCVQDGVQPREQERKQPREQAQDKAGQGDSGAWQQRAGGAWQEARGEQLTPGWPKKWQKNWHKIGPWLLWKGEIEAYRRMRHSLLEKKILLPGNPRIPAILPFDYTDGEIAPFLHFQYGEDYGKV